MNIQNSTPDIQHTPGCGEGTDLDGVCRVEAADVVDVRWEILRPGFPRESAIFDGDDAPGTQHFAAFCARRVVGVASIYRAAMAERPDEPNAWQLRGMATLPSVRGLGLGKALLATCKSAAREAGARILWCNARVTASDFYARQGWQIVGPEFDIPTVGPHFRMFIELRAAPLDGGH
jgi:L-Ala-D/L-Glu epimerase